MTRAQGPAEGTSEGSRFAAIVLVLLVGFAAPVAYLQGRLSRSLHDLRMREDLYVLPPPNALKVLSLGHRSTAADLLWAQLLVENGLHQTEKRAFPDMDLYFDAVQALDPAFRIPYLYADSLLCFRPGGGGKEKDIRKARALMEAGLKALPDDHELWLHYGQLLAFLSPSFVSDPAELDRWRKDGAEAIMHAIELGANPDRAVSAASILNRRGEREAAIGQLKRAYSLTDDPAVRADITQKLENLQASEALAEADRRLKRFDAIKRASFSFLGRQLTLLVGPPFDPARCVGLDTGSRPECSREWSDVLENRTEE
ncbi:MAG: hypothetical protein U0169_07715 [Polyangiaceae bacterium]